MKASDIRERVVRSMLAKHVAACGLQRRWLGLAIANI